MGKHSFFTAEQLATRFDFAVTTIDHYANEGLLRPVTLNDGRFFHAGDMIRMDIIQKGRRFGFSLRELKLLMDSTRQSH